FFSVLVTLSSVQLHLYSLSPILIVSLPSLPFLTLVSPLVRSAMSSGSKGLVRSTFLSVAGVSLPKTVATVESVACLSSLAVRVVLDLPSMLNPPAFMVILYSTQSPTLAFLRGFSWPPAQTSEATQANTATADNRNFMAILHGASRNDWR